MTFIDALKTGRPMRRKTGITYSYPWTYLGKIDTSPDSLPCWREIETGKIIGLFSFDYIAEDWEAMP